MTFTKDAILSRLIAAYSGASSTEEGSFAGDVLRACADAMAELWSMEIDGMEQRAFVSTAVGDWLSAVCADRGVQRREGESDDALRTRTLEKLSRQPASGNADHYRAWCAQVPQILRVRVLPLCRGNGTVDLIAVGQDGAAPSAAVLEAAQEIIERERPVGVDARIFPMQEVPLHIQASLSLMDGASLERVQAGFTAAVQSFCREIALQTDTVSYAKVLRLLLDSEGVADVASFTLCGGEESLHLDARSAAVCGTLSLQEAAP